MVLAILGNMQWGSWKCWKKKLLCIPILIYDFGTMLLLTGDDSRFFFITFYNKSGVMGNFATEPGSLFIFCEY